MPRKRRRSKRRGRRLTLQEFIDFLLGPGSRDERIQGFPNSFPDFETARQAWFDNRERLLDQNPARSPWGFWAWWQYEAPEPRRVVGRRKRCPAEGGGYEDVLEDKSDYLDRLGIRKRVHEGARGRRREAR